MVTHPLLDQAAELDRADRLAPFRGRFVISDPQLIYLDGNSLGRLVARGQTAVETATQVEWGEGLVRSWGQWFNLPSHIGNLIGRLIGASEGETIISDSTSVNLFKLLVAALIARPHGKIITDSSNFPSDQYVLQGVVKLLGRESDLMTVEGEESLRQSLANIDDVALLTLSHVCFKSGYLYDGAYWTRWTHDRGGLTLWDLSHSCGAVPVDLSGWGADLAVGCCYKYLNGGPGAPAFLFVRKDLHDALENPIWGWIGMSEPFSFKTTYEPAKGIEQFQVGTPPILSVRPIEAGAEMILEAGIMELRAKSLALTEFAIRAWQDELQHLGVTLGSPLDPQLRGSHVALRHPNAHQIDQALILDSGVIPDFRAPDTIRFGVCPLYTTFRDVASGVVAMRRIIESGSYARFDPRVAGVT